MVAHRGVSGLERENTVAAFLAAGNRSYYGMETDIYRTNDGNFILNHDGNLMRIAGENLKVEEASYETLRRITLDDAVLADEIFTVLMGEQVEPRKEFIEQNAKYVVNLDI